MDTLPDPVAINTAVNHTSAAIAQLKQAWADWATIIAVVYPIVVHSLAWFKGLQNVPVLGNFLNVVSGNYGAAKNKS
jgi:hypothetical protein